MFPGCFPKVFPECFPPVRGKHGNDTGEIAMNNADGGEALSILQLTAEAESAGESDSSNRGMAVATMNKTATDSKRKNMNNCSPPDELLTVDEVASRLRVKQSWVYRHADSLGAIHLGKYVRFSWAVVLERLRLIPQTNDEN
jgi:hypothetical protein